MQYLNIQKKTFATTTTMSSAAMCTCRSLFNLAEQPHRHHPSHKERWWTRAKGRVGNIWRKRFYNIIFRGSIYIYIYIYMCVCVRVCLRNANKNILILKQQYEKRRTKKTIGLLFRLYPRISEPRCQYCGPEWAIFDLKYISVSHY